MARTPFYHTFQVVCCSLLLTVSASGQSLASSIETTRNTILVTFAYSENEKITYFSGNGRNLGEETHRRKSTQGFLIRQRGGKLYVAFPDADAVMVNNEHVKSSGPVAARGKKECVQFATEAGATKKVCARYDQRSDGVVEISMDNAFPDENGKGSATLSFRFDGRKCTFIRYWESNTLGDYYAPFLAGPSGGGAYERAERVVSREGTSGKCSVK